MFCSLLKIYCSEIRYIKLKKKKYHHWVRIDRKCSRVRRPVLYFVNVYVDKYVMITTGCASKIYKKKVLFLIYTEAVYAERKYVSQHEYI